MESKMRGINTDINTIRQMVFSEIAQLSYDYDENDDIAWDTPVADFVMSDGAPVEGSGGQNNHHI